MSKKREEPRLPRLPRPPDQQEDRVNDLGWFSHGPTIRAHREAEDALEPLLLEEGEPSGLPPDPAESPPLPEPPPQEPDTEQRGRRSTEQVYRGSATSRTRDP
jgi:hypothetical protein